jgi:predicted PurR-regulated permease PerM
MLASVIWPAVNYLHYTWRMPRGAAGTLMILILVAIVGVGILWGFAAVERLLRDLPLTEKSLQETYELLRLRVADISPELVDQILPPDHRDSMFYQNAERFITEFQGRELRYIIAGVMPAIWQILLILFLVLFLAIEGEMLIRRTVEIFGPSSGPDSQAAARALVEMARQIRAYLVWRTIINMGMAIVLGVIFTQLGLRQGWTWAVLAGVLTYVPYLGPIAAGIPPTIEAFVHGGPGLALIVIAIYVVILTLEGYVVFPLVIGRKMEMNATTVILACVFWWVVWDEVGLFLAPPLMAGIKAICQHTPGWQPWANLMGMEPNQPGSAGFVRRNFVNPILNLFRGRSAEPEPKVLPPAREDEITEVDLSLSEAPHTDRPNRS